MAVGYNVFLPFQLMHAVNRKKGIFENVNIDWHLSHCDEGYTDFSDDETLDDHRNLTLNGSHGAATPNGRHSHHHSHTLHSPDKVRTLRWQPTLLKAQVHFLILELR